MSAFSIQPTEGDIDLELPGAGKKCSTHYWLYGELKSGKRPLICLHGGPGIPHSYLDPIKKHALTGAPVIFYDQVGCGASTRLTEKAGDVGFWTPELFLSELDNLLAHLGIQDDYDLLGQSWGGMLAAQHAIRQPKGLHRLVIANSPASMRTWVSEAQKLLAQLPEDIQKRLLKHEAEGTTDSEDYEAAMMPFYDRHVCRIQPMPDFVAQSFIAVKGDSTVYGTMNGPSEFAVVGSLKEWTIVDQVHKINVTTLLINGKYDEATDIAVDEYFRSIPKVKWVRFANSSHMPHAEEEEEYLEVLANFLA